MIPSLRLRKNSRAAPFLQRVETRPEKVDPAQFPFTIRAVLFSLDGEAIQKTEYRDTKHFLITRDFLNSPERFFKHLFDTNERPSG